MKLSVITAVYNRQDVIEDALRSLHEQTWQAWEHVVIDGASTDRTVDRLHACPDGRRLVLSEPDDGIYNALNKGLRMATGDVIGFLHSDDMYAHPAVLADVAAAFADPEVDAVYGNLRYVSKSDTGKVIRTWRAGAFQPGQLKWGWMPPHPTLYLRRHVYERVGGFNESYRISADYDFVLRCFASQMGRVVWLPQVLVNMRVGGASNGSLSRLVRKYREDYAAIKSSDCGGGVATILAKNLRKSLQYF
jgi:glycosyltransferase